MTLSLLRPPSPRLVVASLAAAAVLVAASPASAIKLWERHRKPTAEPATTPEAAPVARPASEPKAPAPVADAEPTAAAPAAPATAKASRRAKASASPATGVAEALPLPAGHDPFAPATFLRRPELLPRLEAEATAAMAPMASDQARLAYPRDLVLADHPVEAAHALLRLLDEQPDLVPAWSALGSLLRVEGRLALSRGVLEHAVSLDPEDAVAWYQLGLTRRTQDDTAGADAAYLAALEADPRLWLPRVNPHVVVNDRAKAVLHEYYLRRGGPAGPLGVVDSQP